MKIPTAVFAFLMLVSGAVFLQAGPEKELCKSIPNQYSDCNQWGGFLCAAKKGGSCNNCAGPGGLPRKTCYLVEYTCNCANTNTGCGTETTGNCQQTSGGDWFCNGTTSAGHCDLDNCSGGCTTPG